MRKIDMELEGVEIPLEDGTIYSIEFKTNVNKYGMSLYPLKNSLNLISKEKKDCCLVCKWCKIEDRHYGGSDDLAFLCKKNAPFSDKGYPLVEAMDICGDFKSKEAGK